MKQSGKMDQRWQLVMTELHQRLYLLGGYKSYSQIACLSHSKPMSACCACFAQAEWHEWSQVGDPVMHIELRR
jgi:hypothetical protein